MRRGLTPAGTSVTDTWGPARDATLTDGTQGSYRPHSHTTYDQGAPNSGINPATSTPYWTRQPRFTGSDAGTILTTDYTAAGNSANPGSGSRPERAELICRTYPAAAPDSGSTVPDGRVTTSWTTAYDRWAGVGNEGYASSSLLAVVVAAAGSGRGIAVDGSVWVDDEPVHGSAGVGEVDADLPGVPAGDGGGRGEDGGLRGRRCPCRWRGRRGTRCRRGVTRACRTANRGAGTLARGGVFTGWSPAGR